MQQLLILTVLSVMMTISSTADEKPMSLAEKIKRFARTEIRGDVSKLSAGDRKALAKLVEAAKLMDRIYIRQVWSGNEALRKKLEADKSPVGKERLHYFNINMGPWSKIDHDEAFIKGVLVPRPPVANYYPEDMTKEEFEAWIATLSENDQKKARGFFYTIRRDSNRKLKLVPYNEEYKEFLDPAAKLLREAAKLTDNTSLKSFLTKRADAFMSNDYYDSDVAWMDLDSPIEPTIGPYEVYMDETFNYKAAFEAFICLRNDKETKNLEKYSSHLQEIEDNLPIDPKQRNPKLGALAPIRVVDEVAIGGEARAGVQTAAFNLPNDEKVTEEKGSKRVMLKNVQEAKFKHVLMPISNIAVIPDQQPLISFDLFFTHILAHELMHGLGPHNIVVNGKETTVRQAMKDLSSALEEAKADISGLFALQFLIDKGVVDKATEQKMYVTFLASMFRTIRFGAKDAHGRGMALQFNFLMDEGALHYHPTFGAFYVDFDRIKPAVRKLTAEIMTIQAEGSYEKAKALLDKYAEVRTVMNKVLKRLGDIPVDIEPVFRSAK
ncbi:MAG: MutT/nudix family protein [Bacteroidetes bacterium]|nr:MutT/nudix family protein [Bacteroidota bacterium]